jgi:hypothetical protein
MANDLAQREVGLQRLRHQMRRDSAASISFSYLPGKQLGQRFVILHDWPDNESFDVP